MSVTQTLWDAHKTEQDFILNALVSNIIERCIFMKTDYPEVSFGPEENVPDIVCGDYEML